jgi:hypothetical protein
MTTLAAISQESFREGGPLVWRDHPGLVGYRGPAESEAWTRILGSVLQTGFACSESLGMNNRPTLARPKTFESVPQGSNSVRHCSIAKLYFYRKIKQSDHVKFFHNTHCITGAWFSIPGGFRRWLNGACGCEDDDDGD